MATAKYTILVPTQDEAGNPLRLADAVHHYLSYGPMKVQAATVHHGRPFDAVAAWAEDLPEHDSGMKQAGVHAAELANAPMIVVTKEGKSAASWQMANKRYQPGMPADPSAFANQSVLQAPGSPAAPAAPLPQPGAIDASRIP